MLLSICIYMSMNEWGKKKPNPKEEEQWANMWKDNSQRKKFKCSIKKEKEKSEKSSLVIKKCKLKQNKIFLTNRIIKNY